MKPLAYIWQSGELGEALSLHDRGLNFGDGCFTTIRLVRSGSAGWQCALWPYHQARLKHTCARLGFSLPLDLEFAVEHVLRQAAIPADLNAAVLRITVTRGQGGSGYSPVENCTPTLIFKISEWPEHYKIWQQQGITMHVAKFRLGIQPAFAGLKTLNRLEQVAIKRELAATDCDDLLVQDTQGYLVEASAGNLFWQRNGTWYTPSVSHAGIDGVVRQWLIRHNPNIQVVREPVSVLDEAQELFVCNALMGLVPVRAIDSRQLPRFRSYGACVETGELPL
ncbi:aminodeoxychorismate lyase [Aliidiomarina indica]|uniref:aminodeoxychorismate lyase n=1 Tax=Aliidiomarina indica TaxID=2749147 RepID=UPI00188F3AAA|nr:aminodeoxychorismate lyase [Aliidiomarina indica]